MSERSARLIGLPLFSGSVFFAASLLEDGPGPDEIIVSFAVLIACGGLLLFSLDYILSWIPSGRFTPHSSANLRCSCGYDLRGTIRAGKTECPECGRRFLDDAG